MIVFCLNILETDQQALCTARFEAIYCCRLTICEEGDLYDPAGTITGGSAPKGGNLLMKLQELSELPGWHW